MPLASSPPGIRPITEEADSTTETRALAESALADIGAPSAPTLKAATSELTATSFRSCVVHTHQQYVALNRSLGTPTNHEDYCTVVEILERLPFESARFTWIVPPFGGVGVRPAIAMR